MNSNEPDYILYHEVHEINNEQLDCLVTRYVNSWIDIDDITVIMELISKMYCHVDSINVNNFLAKKHYFTYCVPMEHDARDCDESNWAWNIYEKKYGAPPKKIYTKKEFWFLIIGIISLVLSISTKAYWLLFVPIIAFCCSIGAFVDRRENRKDCAKEVKTFNALHFNIYKKEIQLLKILPMKLLKYGDIIFLSPRYLTKIVEIERICDFNEFKKSILISHGIGRHISYEVLNVITAKMEMILDRD